MTTPQPTRDDQPADAAARAALEGSARFVLDDEAVLHASGNDAAGFLHAQLSSDIRALAPGDALLTSYSDARGRVLAVPRLLARDDGFLLALTRERLEPVRGLLAKYVLRADVSLAEAGADHERFGVCGQSASVALAGAAGELPQAIWQSTVTPAGATIVRLQGPRPRWLVDGPAAAVRPLWDALDGHVHTAGAAAWRLLEIEAGIPNVYDATAGRYVAQMLNLDRLGAIDFAKGCYPGQEVIARTHYLGRIKRRMYVLRSDAGEAPAPGTEIHAGGAAVGSCVDAAPHPDGGCLALAVLRVESAAAELAIGGPDGTPAHATAPPYPLEDAA